SAKKVKDVLSEFAGNGRLSKYSTEQHIDFEGFRTLMTIYLDVDDIPSQFCQHLFRSFQTKPSEKGEELEGDRTTKLYHPSTRTLASCRL
ncbi:hypothetical protein chiPu_0023297, partial [Chiloscyllium punctatum]|nr:hypothetical protein [Chiloscyllium punctatum]